MLLQHLDLTESLRSSSSSSWRATSCLPTRRCAPRGLLARNSRGQSALWAYGISGDLPIVTYCARDPRKPWPLAPACAGARVLAAQGLAADLVIWNEDISEATASSCRRDLGRYQLQQGETSLIDKPGGIFVRRTDQISEPDRLLMQTVARLI